MRNREDKIKMNREQDAKQGAQSWTWPFGDWLTGYNVSLVPGRIDTDLKVTQVLGLSSWHQARAAPYIFLFDTFQHRERKCHFSMGHSPPIRMGN